MSNLHKKFAEAGLKVLLPKKPIRATDENIFQMDVTREFVKRDNKRVEVFRIWKGHPDNRVIVLNVDKKLKQLVLLVDEPAREFETELGKFQRNRVIKVASSERITLREAFTKLLKSEPGVCTKKRMTVKERTPGNKRHYLCGVDERQLFIAQLPKGISSVKQAHQDLKGTTVQTAEGRAPGRTQRQGEWFFLNCTAEETRRINTVLRAKNGKARIEKNIRIDAEHFNTGGKPHIAAERLVLDAPELAHGFAANARPDIFVRGKVTHPDHRPMKFKQWRKVLLNNEVRAATPSMRTSSGVYWID